MARIMFIHGAWLAPLCWDNWVHGLAADFQDREFQRHIVPESGRIFSHNSPVKINFGNSQRPPLLIIGGGSDIIVPASVNRVNHKRYVQAGVATDYKEFPGRCHWTLAQPGWEEVAEYTASWLSQRVVID